MRKPPIRAFLNRFRMRFLYLKLIEVQFLTSYIPQRCCLPSSPSPHASPLHRKSSPLHAARDASCYTSWRHQLRFPRFANQYWREDCDQGKPRRQYPTNSLTNSLTLRVISPDLTNDRIPSSTHTHDYCPISTMVASRHCAHTWPTQ